MLDNLKNFDSNKASIDEMVSLRSYARQLMDEYDTQVVEVPGWVTAQAENLDRQIEAKNQERLHAKRREVMARLENLKTPTEKRSEYKKELALLDRKIKGVAA